MLQMYDFFYFALSHNLVWRNFCAKEKYLHWLHWPDQPLIYRLLSLSERSYKNNNNKSPGSRADEAHFVVFGRKIKVRLIQSVAFNWTVKVEPLHSAERKKLVGESEPKIGLAAGGLSRWVLLIEFKCLSWAVFSIRKPSSKACNVNKQQERRRERLKKEFHLADNLFVRPHRADTCKTHTLEWALHLSPNIQIHWGLGWSRRCRRFKFGHVFS